LYLKPKSSISKAYIFNKGALLMSEPFLGQIYLVGYNFAARGFSLCNGQLLPISQNSALFSLLGTTYGGDGRTTFALPDLRGRVPMHFGNGPGLTDRRLGQRSGQETVTLTAAEMPSHSHTVNATNADGDKGGPGGKILAASPPGGNGSETIYSDTAPTKQMNSAMISNTGGSQAHQNMQPYLVLNYQIALQGIFPSRS